MSDRVVIGKLGAGEVLTEESLARMFADFRRDHPGDRLFVSPREMALGEHLTPAQVQLAHQLAAHFANEQDAEHV